MAALALCAADLMAAEKLTLTKARIQFTSETPIESFTGSGNTAEGEIDPISRRIRVRVILRDFTTNLRRRDEHMHQNHLETEQFPYTEFNGTIDHTRIAAGDASAHGELTLHGITRPAVLSGKVEKIPGGYRVRCSFPVKLSDFQISVPRFLIMKISEEIRIDAELEFQEK